MTDAPTLLRDRNAPGHGRVGFIELFFDLVFVFAVTRLSHLLLGNLTPAGAAQTAFLLLAVWTVWVWTTWASNWLDSRHPTVRLMFLTLMGAGLIMSAAIPEAFGDRALAFAAAFAFMQNARNAVIVWALRGGAPNERRNFIRIQIWLLVGGALWIAGAFAEGEARWAIWIAALFAELGSPWWGFWTPGLGRSTTDDWRVDPAHMAERCGLFVILALGESIIILGATFADLAWDVSHLAAFGLGLTGAAATWWIYFASAAERAEEAFARHRDAGRVARAAYTYAHIPIVAGIILTAVACELVLAHPTARGEAEAFAVILGGPALFLLGNAIFARLACGNYPHSHFAGLLALLAAFVAAVFTGAGSSLIGAAGVSVVVLLLVAGRETLRRRRINESRADATAG